MTEVVQFDTVPTEQAATWLQGHLTFFAGYALALAQKAGLSPEEAATLAFLQQRLHKQARRR